MRKIILIIAAAAALTACGEKPQTADGARLDAAPHTGTGKPYAIPGWKQGDKASWEAQLKTRGQMGQNEYNRTN